MGKKILAWIVPALMLGTAACGRSEPEPTFTVAGKGDAVNAFVAAQLVKQIPRKMTVAIAATKWSRPLRWRVIGARMWLN